MQIIHTTHGLYNVKIVYLNLNVFFFILGDSYLLLPVRQVVWCPSALYLWAATAKKYISVKVSCKS